MLFCETCQSWTLNSAGVVNERSHPRLECRRLLVIGEGIVAVIKGQPDVQVVAEAANGHEAAECCGTHTPDVTLMDLRLTHTYDIDAAVPGSKSTAMSCGQSAFWISSLSNRWSCFSINMRGTRRGFSWRKLPFIPSGLFAGRISRS